MFVFYFSLISSLKIGHNSHSHLSCWSQPPTLNSETKREFLFLFDSKYLSILFWRMNGNQPKPLFFSDCFSWGLRTRSYAWDIQSAWRTDVWHIHHLWWGDRGQHSLLTPFSVCSHSWRLPGPRYQYQSQYLFCCLPPTQIREEFIKQKEINVWNFLYV